MWRFVLISFFVWRIALFLIAWFGNIFVVQRTGFLGPSVWANFDGVHYLSIAENGYLRYQEAFFPLYPLLIRFLAKMILFENYLWAGLFVSHLTFFVALVIFYKLVKSEFSEKVAKMAVLGFLVFPASFFSGAVYTESLFLALILASFYAARRQNWFLAGLFGGLASTTKLVGIFLLPALLWEWRKSNSQFLTRKLSWLLLIPAGLLLYMLYLNGLVGDPLAFIHAQPAFGAQRTGGEIVFLPQVYWRYLKIFFTVPFRNYDLWIALLEFLTFNFTFLSLWQAWKKRINPSYLIFSLPALLGPTLTGTFSSIPRYTLVLFPIFIFYGLIESKGFRITFFVSSFSLLAILTILFTRGFFVA